MMLKKILVVFYCLFFMLLFSQVIYSQNFACNVLYNNGPFITHPGSGPGGADISRLQTSLGMTSLGFGHQFVYGNRIADDFQVTDPNGWYIDLIEFYAYQTNSSTTSPITGYYIQIWNGPPNDPNSSVIWGDLTTNRMVATQWANAYRDTESAPNSTTRPIMMSRCAIGIHLPPGTYWLDWMADGSSSYSGPWAPPITILGQTTTGNALQFVGGDWTAAIDYGTSTQQGFPFIIYNCGGGCPTINLSPSSLPSGTIGVPYNQTISATNGTPPYNYSIISGNLPPGLNFDGSTGVIFGIPTQQGSYSFSIKVVDNNGCTGMKDYTIDISQQIVYWSFYDDYGRTKVCINSQTGEYTWYSLFSFKGYQPIYNGVASIVTVSNGFVLRESGDKNYGIRLFFDNINKIAVGTYIPQSSPALKFPTLEDSNVDDSPPCT